MSERHSIRRLGFIHPVPNPACEANWSGTPAALAAAIAGLGVEVVPIAYRLPRLVRGAILAASSLRGRGAIARGSELQVRARTRVLAHELHAVGPIDAVVAVGTDLFNLAEVVPTQLPVASYDDGTFAQFMRYRDSDLCRQSYPDRAIAAWAMRQAAAARQAAACCVSTEWAARSMIADYGVRPERVHVVGMGHTPRQYPQPERAWPATRYLFVGTDWGRKNGDAVLAAFGRVRTERPYVLLDLVGDHPAIELPGVRGHGFLPREDRAAQERLDHLFGRATAFVLPSRFDPSPIACLEAASAGLPVIATTEGGAGELLGGAAITVHPDDRDRLTDAMRLLADPQEAQRRGRLARQTSIRSTWSCVAQRILTALATPSREAHLRSEHPKFADPAKAISSVTR